MKRSAFSVFCALFFLNSGFAQEPTDTSATIPALEQPMSTPPAEESDEITVPVKQAPAPEAKEQAAPPEKPVEKPAEKQMGNGSPVEKQSAPAEEPKQAEGPAPTEKDKLSYEISAGSVTVGGRQWTRVAFGVDVPLWKFGIFFDVEAFLDQRGDFSKKGWDFENNPLDAVMRKVRYVRFGHEDEPLFVKVGGLSNVTIGHGFIVDRFTNMLHYPDQHLLGLQFYLDDITPLGLSFQVMGADLQELRDKYHGGVGAVRLAIKPLKPLKLPLLSNLSIGGTYAEDRNTFAPARDWKQSGDAEMVKELKDAGRLDPFMVDLFRRTQGFEADSLLAQVAAEESAGKKVSSFGIYGMDLNLPLIATSLLSLDVYAQSGVRADSLRGWGIGAPGVALKVWRLNAQVEYRHTQGRFVPGFFGPYYLDERLMREPEVRTKADFLQDDTLNGVFGSLGFDIANVLVIGGAYQYMKGKTDDQKDQRFELTGNIGSLVLSKIPKIRKLEAYLYKTHITSDIVGYDTTVSPRKPVYDAFFEKTPFFYYGYRLGFEISPGATLICDTRFGNSRDKTGKLVPVNEVSVQTAFSF